MSCHLAPHYGGPCGQPPPPPTPPRAVRLPRRAFTLIEMVSVTGVLFLLVAIFLPSLSKSKRAGMRSACTYNQHNLDTAISSFALDTDKYPYQDPVLNHLVQSGYMTQVTAEQFKCPADRGPTGDTYSVGYIGGNPATISDTDPLLVCGWHPVYGSIGLFADHTVQRIQDKKGSTSIPVTYTFDLGGAEPGFVLQDNTPLTITSADGNQAAIYGDGGVYLITASYDPFASYGNGAFSIAVGFTPGVQPKQKVKSQNNNQVEFVIRLRYANVVIYASTDGTETKITYDQNDQGVKVDTLKVQNYSYFRVEHRMVAAVAEGEYIPGVTPGSPNVQFRMSEDALVQQ